MKKCTKVIFIMIVIAVIMSMGVAVFAVENTATEETMLSGLSNDSAVQATNRYFKERNAYLLDETSVINWSVVGIVNDEIAHKAMYTEKNIILSDISYIVDTVVCFDAHAEVVVTESVSYIKDGVAGEEEVVHTLTIYTDSADIPVVTDDEYQELFSGFVSCSYIDPVAQTSTSSAGGGSLCIVEIAKGELGVAETGYNITKYGAWYGLNGQPWCAMFVSWCANQANVSTSIIKKTASCTDMCNQFKSQGKFYKSAARGGNYTPVAGDIIFFGADITMKHVGIVAMVEDGKVWFYDGNHIAEVTYRSRKLTSSGIGGYGHPAYESAEHAYVEYQCSETHHWQECTVCGYTTEEATHSISHTYEYNSTHHWNTCSYCGSEKNKAQHIRIDLGYGQYKCKFCDCRVFAVIQLNTITTEEILGG